MCSHSSSALATENEVSKLLNKICVTFNCLNLEAAILVIDDVINNFKETVPNYYKNFCLKSNIKIMSM